MSEGQTQTDAGAAGIAGIVLMALALMVAALGAVSLGQRAVGVRFDERHVFGSGRV